MNTLKTPILFFLLFQSAFLFAQNCSFTSVLLTTQTQAWGEEISWQLINENGETLASFENGSSENTYETTACLPDGCYTIQAADSYGDGWNGGNLQITFNQEVLNYTLEDGSEGLFWFGINTSGCQPLIPGCTDPTAMNYDPAATVDDGSCTDFAGILQAQLIDTICYGGPKDNRINWVMQNRGTTNPSAEFTSAEEFSQAFEEDLLRAFTLGDSNEQIPYAQYKSFFNLYAVYWPDAPSDEEWWNFDIIKNLRDEIFLPWANEETGWATWFSTTKFGGGGGAGLVREERVGDGKMFGMGWETLLHEFGHTMPGLLDEYSASGEWSNSQCWETPNTTGFTRLDDIPWRKWIEPGTPLPTPYTEEYLDKYGAFEGALTNYFGCHRPTARGCYMGAGGFGEGYGDQLCGPCQQRVICFLYQYVDVIENPIPQQQNLSVSGNQTITFSAEVLKPEPNTQKYEWFLNGKLIASGVEEVEVTFGACAQYELIFAVTDTNHLVRYDPKFDEIYPKPYREHKWTIDQVDISEYSLEASLTSLAADCTGEANGGVEIAVIGGVPPYEFINQTIDTDTPLSNLPKGEYTYTIADANGCSIEQVVNVGQEALLDVQLCSEYLGNAWRLFGESQNYDTNELIFAWSTGENSAEIIAESGTYQVTISTPSGCSQIASMTLNTVAEELGVSHEVFASSLSRNTGQIFVEVEGGQPPYQISWADLPFSDLTDTNTEQIIASGTTWGHSPSMAFDDSQQTKWLHAIAEGAWIGYHIPGGARVNLYAITSADDVPARDPRNWVFQGSQDGENWTDLHEVTNHQFDSRFQEKRFAFDNETAYAYYRFYVLNNHGDIATQLQELAFLGTRSGAALQLNNIAEGQMSRSELAPGYYRYTVKDQNGAVRQDTVWVPLSEAFQAEGLQVVQVGDCKVAIENPNEMYTYYWLPDETGSQILHKGVDFSPPTSGNYYVAAKADNAPILSSNRKGFAVIMPEAPEIISNQENVLEIVEPQLDLVYSWYAENNCDALLQTGTTFQPVETGTYFASAKMPESNVNPIDPVSIPGMIIRIDAADLNGDGDLDDPAPESSSLLGWYFTNGNFWSPGSWFAYRANYQNGLGIADFATIWLQGMEQGETGFQTIIMAYEENPISFPGTAPFFGLSHHLPKHSDDSQLFANDAPASTLDGTTFLNGAIVDPLTTPNPMKFCVLGQRLTEVSNRNVQNTDTRWEGKVGEILLWDHALTDEEMQGVSAYLGQKWLYTAQLESAKTGIFWEAPVQQVEAGKPSLEVFPNPAQDEVYLKGLQSGQQLQLFNAMGRLVFETNITAELHVLNIANLPSSWYVLQILDEDGKPLHQQKLIKK